MNLRRKIKEELNKQLLRENKIDVDIDCCPKIAGCICKGTIINGTVDASCCFSGCPDCHTKNDENLGTYGTNPNEGPRRHDMEMARRRPYSARYTDMRGSRDMGKM